MLIRTKEMLVVLCSVLLCAILCACGKNEAFLPESEGTQDFVVLSEEYFDTDLEEEDIEPETEDASIRQEPQSEVDDADHETLEELPKEEQNGSSEESSMEDQSPTSISTGGKLIVIDAGHQAHGNSEHEPIGPGATETKPKVSGGATGCVTGVKEYELNLLVANYLKTELEARGYTVIMVRESHDVDMSNSERAMVANEAGADAFIRIHANGSEDSSVHGALTMCQTPENPYNGYLYEESRELSECVLNGLVEETGCLERSIIETDTMSGINWCTVPTTIVEMGFLSNPEEDAKMATTEYQQQLAVGIADGMDAYFISE